MSDYTQTNLTELQHNLLLSTLFLLALHIIVSFVMICVSIHCKKTIIVTSAWVVSLNVTIAAFVLVLLAFIEKSETPCPIQISEPFVEDKIFGSKTRKDIEHTINKLNEILPEPIPAYSGKRKYLIITKHYLESLNISLTQVVNMIQQKCQDDPPPPFCEKITGDTFNELVKDLESAHVVPIGYVEGDKIFGLYGQQLIPPQIPDPTPVPTPSTSPAESFTYI